jgi:hypothetical protein
MKFALPKVACQAMVMESQISHSARSNEWNQKSETIHSAFQIQKALYAHQQKLLRERLQSPTPFFKRYARRYAQATNAIERRVELDEFKATLQRSHVVLVGDYHTHRSAQDTFIELCHSLLKQSKQLIIALEFVEARHQKILDAFLKNKITEKSFLNRIGHPYSGAYSVWPHFRPIFQLAKDHNIKVIAIDSRSSKPDSLRRRDVKAAQLMGREISDGAVVLCLVGQYHIAPAHLPREIRRAHGPARVLSVFQNPEGAYFALLKKSSEVPACVSLGSNRLALFPSTPVACQRSFLDYVDAEGQVLGEHSMPKTVRHLVRQIAQTVGVRVTQTQLADLLITLSSDPNAFQKLCDRGSFSTGDRALLKQLLSGRESLFVPKARAIHLSSLTLAHAAEEAAHFVRFAALGQTMEKPKQKRPAFFHRCLEEALAYLGVRLVNGKTELLSIEAHQLQFQSARGAARKTSAYAVAIASAIAAHGHIPGSILPMKSTFHFHATSHALGHILGEKLFQKWITGALKKDQLKSLFLDVFAEPETEFRRLFA